MITSYAQHFEDVMLWRALKHVPNGRYIDIGANDPVVDSVSLLFYEQGWRGLHVEPMPAYSERLRVFRPDEEVIEAAVSDTPGFVSLFQFEGTGLTTSDKDHARLHAAVGRTFRKIKSRTLPLTALFDRFETEDVHWLKIDVEGMEGAVLRSWRDHTARPWIVVIESTLPNTAIQSHVEWETELVSRGYKFVYFDGLNRFYVHEDRSELAKSFQAPPNFFDEFVLSRHSPFVSNLAGEIADLASQTSTAIAISREKAAEIGALTYQVRDKASIIGQMHQLLESKAAEIGMLEADRSAKLEELTTFRDAIEKKASEIGLLLANLDEKSTRIAQLEDAHETLTHNVAAARSEAQAWRSRADAYNLQRQADGVVIAAQAEAVVKLQQEQARLMAHIQWQDARLEEVWRSSSWRATEPFRRIRRVVHRLSAPLIVRAKQIARSGIDRGRIFVQGKPRLRRLVIAGLDFVPPVKTRLMRYTERQRGMSSQLTLSEAFIGDATKSTAPWSGTYEDDVNIALEVLRQN